MKNTDEYKKGSPEETDHDLVILLLGFRGFCPPCFVPKEPETGPQPAKAAPKAKKEPVRSKAELESLVEAYYAARESDTSVLIAEMARHMGVTPSTVRKKLNKYPERFAPYLGRVSLIDD